MVHLAIQRDFRLASCIGLSVVEALAVTFYVHFWVL